MAIQNESKKGQECPYKPILCPESTNCANCQIYIDYLGYLKSMGRLASLVPEWLIGFERERG